MEVPPSQPANSPEGASASKALIIVSRNMGLQDALWILFHKRAPFHFPSQKQILTVHGVQVLHLEVERAGGQRKGISGGGKDSFPKGRRGEGRKRKGRGRREEKGMEWWWQSDCPAPRLQH